MLSYRNVLFCIQQSINLMSKVTKIIGINVNEVIMSYDISPNGGDHLTSIGTIVIWTVRS